MKPKPNTALRDKLRKLFNDNEWGYTVEQLDAISALIQDNQESKRIDKLKAVATDYGIPVTKLIDFVTSYGGGATPDELEAHELLSNRIDAAEKNGLSADYINGLKDARKLIAPMEEKTL